MTIHKVNPDDPAFDLVAKRIVQQAANLSTCKRRKVGAAVFDLAGKLIATGYNREEDDDLGGRKSCMEGDCPRGMAPYDVIPADSPYGDCIAVHAEVMAIRKAELLTATEGSLDVGMVVTHKPCHECTALIERLGIETYYLEEL